MKKLHSLGKTRDIALLLAEIKVNIKKKRFQHDIDYKGDSGVILTKKL